MLVKCNTSKSLNACSMWFMLSVGSWKRICVCIIRFLACFGSNLCKWFLFRILILQYYIYAIYTRKPVSVFPPWLTLFGVHQIGALMPGRLPKLTSVWQPLYLEFNFHNVPQDGLDLKLFLCFVQHPTCVMPNSAETSAPNTRHQRKQVPTAP
jgi:hypothetical protein